MTQTLFTGDTISKRLTGVYNYCRVGAGWRKLMQFAALNYGNYFPLPITLKLKKKGQSAVETITKHFPSLCSVKKLRDGAWRNVTTHQLIEKSYECKD